MSRLVVPKMETSGGTIVNISTYAAKAPALEFPISSVARSALSSYTKLFAKKYASVGIRMNNILPGFINTGRLDSLVEGKAKSAGISIEEMANQMIATIPAGRFGKPEELGYYATFLASDFAAYITGTSVQIDGGRTGSL